MSIHAPLSTGPAPVPPPPPPGAGPAVPPVAPKADPRPKTLAILALVAAGIGLIMAFIPFVTWFAALPLLLGFILAIVALAGRTHGGKGLGVSALILSIVGGITSLVMTFVSFGIVGDAVADAVSDDTSISQPGGPVEDEGAVADDSAALQGLTVVESAFGRSTFDDNTWWYVVVVENPNTDAIFRMASIDIEAVDSAGTILDSSSSYTTILSGKSAFRGVFIDIGSAEIAALDIRGPEADDATPAAAADTGAFAIEGVAATSDAYSTTVRGTVSSTFDTEQTLVEVVVVARDAAGAIIGGDMTYLDRVPAGGGKVQFEVMFLDVLPADTTYDAFANL